MNRATQTPDLKTLVSDNKTASFVRFRRGQMWYATECGFEFPVPVEDVGDATFQATERAMLLMRYMRQHLANIAAGRADSIALPARAPAIGMDAMPRC